MYLDGINTPEVRELKAAAFETLLFFPGIDYERWCQVLLKEYTSEVVDVLGDDPEDVMDTLHELWHDGYYEDESTGIGKKYIEWASLLKNQAMVDYYRKLIDEANKEKDRKKDQ